MTEARTPFRVTVPDLQIATAVAAASSLACLAGFWWDGWAQLPVTVRFIAGLVAFGVSPGLLMVGPFLPGRRGMVTTADFAISIITCSFSCNLMLNVLLFAGDWSFPQLSHAYLVVQVLGFAAWAAWAWLRRATAQDSSVHVHLSTSWLIAGGLLTLGIAALTFIAFDRGSPPANPEELLWLRRLISNPVVRYDNLSYREGDPSTYFFVPFQIMIAGTSILARLDVAFTYSVFWAVTTLLSCFVIARLVHVLFERPVVTGLTCLWMVGVGVFDPYAMVNAAGLVIPYPNRYGFASGVLLPLSLLLFWSILRDPVTHAWRWALLVYLTVEMTFVHARETLLALGVMSAVFAILLARPAQHRREIVRIAGVIGVTGLMLVVYKYANLAVAADLGSYVADVSAGCRETLRQFAAEHGWLHAMFNEAPRIVSLRVDDAHTLALGVPGYRDLFVDTWASSFPARLYLPIVLIALPIYASMATSVAGLSLALVLAGLGVMASSGVLQLQVSAAVGNPEIFAAYNVIFLVSLLVLGQMAMGTGSALARWGAAARWRTGLLLAACAALVIAAYVGAERVAVMRAALAAAWSHGTGWALLVLTLAAVGIRVARRDLPLFASVSSPSALAVVAATALMLAVVVPSVKGSAALQANPFAPAFPSHRFTGEFFADYPMLMGGGRLDSTAYPIEIIRYLRESLPAGQTVMAADVLTLLERVPHFTPVVSNRGNVATSFIVNWDYLRRFSRSGPDFKVAPFVADADSRRVFREMLTEYKVDVLIVGPDESPQVTAARESNADLRSWLEPAIEHQGFIVYLIRDPESLTR